MGARAQTGSPCPTRRRLDNENPRGLRGGLQYFAIVWLAILAAEFERAADEDAAFAPIGTAEAVRLVHVGVDPTHVEGEDADGRREADVIEEVVRRAVLNVVVDPLIACMRG